MARRNTPELPADDFEEHILDTDIKQEMESSFLEYAYSVIYSRALPDARDGMKPVQRRILYTMNDMGVRPDLPTGGMIVGLDGVRDAYETGRGTFRMRATARVESVGRRQGIVVTELPYGVGTEKVSERIKSLVQAK